MEIYPKVGTLLWLLEHGGGSTTRPVPRGHFDSDVLDAIHLMLGIYA